MSKIIKISSIAPMAMKEDAGLHLRREMRNAMEQEQQIVLDFGGIELFATPFFNASIGYYIMQLSPERFKKCVQVINLSDLGKETYGHSYQNAVSVYENHIDTEMVGKITAQTIDEQ